MNRTAFDNYCRRTKAIQFDGTVLTVGVCNAMTAEWLESRITSSAEHLLVGILAKHVEVRFVVSDQFEDLRDDE
jgi:chromosomal replication initiation ATPase DnaA